MYADMVFNPDVQFHSPEVTLKIWCMQCGQTNTVPLWIGDTWYCYNCSQKDVITEDDVLDNMGELV